MKPNANGRGGRKFRQKCVKSAYPGEMRCTVVVAESARRGRQLAVLAHVAKQFVQLRVSQRGGARAEAATVVRVRIGLDRADLLAQMAHTLSRSSR